MKLNEIMKTKPGQIGFIIFCLISSAFAVKSLAELVRQRDTRDISDEFAAAVEQLQKSPPGIERGEVFLRRLHAIDPGYAPTEVKDALRDYISAAKQGLDALKAGRDSKQVDDAMGKAGERLVASIKKWR